MKAYQRILAAALLLTAALMGATACAKDEAPSGEATESESIPESSTEPATEITTEKETDMETEKETMTETETTATAEVAELVIAEPGEKRSAYRVVYATDADATLQENAGLLSRAVKAALGTDLRTAAGDRLVKNKVIVIGSAERAETAELAATLQEGEYAIRVDAVEGDVGRVLIAYTTPRSQYLAVEYFVDHFVSPDGVRVPTDLDVRGAAGEHTLVTSQIIGLRDPCILAEDGVYYAYGTGWLCYKNTSGDLGGAWEMIGTVASVADAADDGGSHWAPEVHKYGDAYYMFTTYLSKSTGHRGCAIFCADSPEGPFLQITDGHITPRDWDAIDGTFYVDPEGQPWMVFVHEWTCRPNGIGSFAAARLSDDLTTFASEPIELFNADEALWANRGVTDGCWMYTTAEGELLMIWSNFAADGYSVGIARSSNRRLDGEWTQEVKRLYCQSMGEAYNGGHGMIFTGLDGQMYLSFHSPNSPEGDRETRPCFLAIREENGTLVWDETAAE